jgi:hypothetical protein
VPIVLTDQVSLAFGLPTSTFNATSLAHYMSGTAGLQALAAAGKATFSTPGSGINDVTQFISFETDKWRGIIKKMIVYYLICQMNKP